MEQDCPECGSESWGRDGFGPFGRRWACGECNASFDEVL